MVVSTGAGTGPRDDNAAENLINDAPALTSRQWLPGSSGWEPLDALAVEHRRILAGRGEIADERAALLLQYEAEDKNAQEALERAFTSDGPSAPPAVTSPDERQAAIASLDERLRAVTGVLRTFVLTAVDRIEQDASAILDDLAQRSEAARGRREEAERILAEAAEAEADVFRLGEWVTRNAGRHAMASRRNVPTMRFVGWNVIEEMKPPRAPRLNDAGEPIPEFVDTFPGAEQHAANLNRGRVPALSEIRANPEAVR
jgi:hypothetical protein